jgi:MscS family membrane protein
MKVVNSIMALVFVLIILRAVGLSMEAWAMTFAKKTKTKVDEVIIPLLQKSAKVVFLIVAVLWVLDIWQINITPYLAGAGIAGLVLGMALQDSLKNIFGGLTLILDKTFKAGDKVRLESGEVGTIYDIGLRSTKLVTYDHEIIYIPNGYLPNSKIQNYTRPSPKVRVNVKFGVEYGTEIGTVKKVVLSVITKNKEILSEPEPVVDFVEMGDFALLFEAKFWVEKWDTAFAKKIEMTEAIYNALNKSKIGIPFPTQTV